MCVIVLQYVFIVFRYIFIVFCLSDGAGVSVACVAQGVRLHFYRLETVAFTGVFGE